MDLDDKLLIDTALDEITEYEDDLLKDIASFFSHPKQLESQLSMKNAFNILLDALKGDYDSNIPFRDSASPIYPSESCFYVSKALKQRSSKKRRLKENCNPISVKYSSLHSKNCDVWWNPDYDCKLGVVCRVMSKVSRPKPNSSQKPETRSHGYSGRLFSLIQRKSIETSIENNVNVNMKSYLVDGCPGLVQFWRNEEANKYDSSESNSVVSSGSSTTAISSEASSVFSKVVDTDLLVHGDLFVNGEVSVRNLHVKGNLLVEGTISGQVVTPPGAADYAEWFAYLNPNEDIRPGMVVQLRSPEQKITLDTSGSGPHMIVSTTPSVAAGVPPSVGGNDPPPGALCAFLGQVPVNTKGPVECGQYLFPSGDNDGYAIPARFQEFNEDNEPLGTAMTSCPEGVHSVLSLVRWQHNLKFKSMKEKKRNMNKHHVGVWSAACLAMAEKLMNGIFFYYHTHYFAEAILWIVALLSVIFAFSQFPNYSKFFARGDVFIFIFIGLLRSIFGFFRLGLILSSQSNQDAIADFVSSLLTIYSEYRFAMSALGYANLSMLRNADFRANKRVWVFYDRIFDAIYTELYRSPQKGEPQYLSEELGIDPNRESAVEDESGYPIIKDSGTKKRD